MFALAFGLLLSGSLGAFGQAASTTPTISDNGWRLTIDGAVTRPLNLSLTDLAAMPKTEVYGALYCLGAIVSSGNWGGVLLSDLIQLADISPSVTNLEFHAEDGYAINVSEAAAPGLIVAYELNGQPLTETLRLVLPDYPGNYWISMITKITATMSTNYNIQPPAPGGGPIGTANPAPSMSPQPTNTPASNPTQEPLSTPYPSQTPVSNVTAPPQTSTAPTSSPSSQPTTSPTPTENQSTSSPAASPLGEQQTEPGYSSSTGSPANNGYWVLVGVIAVMVAVGSVVFLHGKNSKIK